MNGSDLYKIDTSTGEPLISTKGLALLLGVSADEWRTEYENQGKPASLKIPVQWARQGRRIAREAMAATGSDSMKDALDYLAGQL